MKKNKLKIKNTFRKCVGCGKINDRSDLIRIMKIYDTCEVVLMPTYRHFGRSSYLCYNNECIKNAIKKKRLQKSLKKEITVSTLENLENLVAARMN